MRHAGCAAVLAGLSVVSGCSQDEAPRHATLEAAPVTDVAQRIPAQHPAEKPVEELPASIPPLETLLVAAPDPEIRREAVYLVADAGEAEDAALVGQALYDPDSRVRESAIEALTGIGGESSADWMLVALGDPDPHIRRTAVEALGEIGGDTAEILLRQSLLDADEGVREAAQQMLDEPKFGEEEIR
jgi:HEAT repeat protein